MPTYEWLTSFARDLAKLTPWQRQAFMQAVAALVLDLKSGADFRRGLRVKKMQGFDNVWEMTWTPDGRATFHFAESVVDRQPHIVWRRIGTHDVFRQP